MSDEQEKTSMSATSWTAALNASSPYAFGVVLLLVIWQAIVQPMMETQRLNFDALQESIRSLDKMQGNQLESSRLNNDTSRLLNEAAKELNEYSQNRFSTPSN